VIDTTLVFIPIRKYPENQFYLQLLYNCTHQLIFSSLTIK